jgi:hypothetical protein
MRKYIHSLKQETYYKQIDWNRLEAIGIVKN